MHTEKSNSQTWFVKKNHRNITFSTNAHKFNLPCNNSNLMQLNGSCGIKLAKFSFGNGDN